MISNFVSIRRYLRVKLQRIEVQNQIVGFNDMVIIVCFN